MIPNIIHQTWKTQDIPYQFVSFIESWKNLHPDYKYMFWTDEDNYEFVKHEYPDMLGLYESIPTPVMKCDFIRYLIIYHYGGYYVDLDVMCHKNLTYLPIDPTLHDVVLTEEHPSHGIEFAMNQIITNWFMGCKINDPFMKEIIEAVKDCLLKNPGVTNPMSITGPFMMTNIFNRLKHKYGERILVLDYEYLNPFPKQYIWKHNRLPSLPAKTIGIHYYVGTWWRKNEIIEKPSKCIESNAAVFTIITPTIGRSSLLYLKQCLKREKLPYIHLIMWDSKRCENALLPREVEDERTFCYEMRHPLQIPKDSSNIRVDVWLRALGISMARTKYIKCCDDDTWPVENHLETVYNYLEDNQLDFTWCFRRMWRRSGEVLGIDKFEATGELNKFGYTLLDNSSLFYNKKAGNILHQVFLQNQIYGDDRYTSQPLHAHCKGKRIDTVLTNHSAQPQLEDFFSTNCSPDE
jgi:hypothetical protein